MVIPNDELLNHHRVTLIQGNETNFIQSSMDFLEFIKNLATIKVDELLSDYYQCELAFIHAGMLHRVWLSYKKRHLAKWILKIQKGLF